MCFDCCQAFLRAIGHDPALLEQIITTDETWVHQYDPETKRQSSEWLLPHEDQPVKPRRAMSTGKCMLVTFFDFCRIVHFEFVRGRTVNSRIFVQILGRLKQVLLTRRPRNRYPLIHTDNASSYTSYLTRMQMIMTGLKSTAHPPLSPDLTPSDFWLFPHLKQGIRGRHFPNLDALEDTMANEIARISLQEYSDCILKMWPKRWVRCLYHHRDYFEGLD